eukprot:SAG31_NODE_3650_length_4028_cov_1.617205_2_plen_169_part_00
MRVLASDAPTLILQEFRSMSSDDPGQRKAAAAEKGGSSRGGAARIFLLQLLSGGGAGAISKTCVAPIERVKVLLQVQEQGAAPWTVAQTILREQGVSAFWRGNGVNVMRIVPNAAIKFSCNDLYKGLLLGKGSAPQPPGPTQRLSVAQKLLAGSASGKKLLSRFCAHY